MSLSDLQGMVNWPAVSDSMTTPTAQRNGKVVECRVFRLTDVPSTMDKLGWTMGAKFMRRWFSTKPGFPLPRDIKRGDTLDSTLGHEHVDETSITWKWLRRFPRFCQDANSIMTDLLVYGQMNTLMGDGGGVDRRGYHAGKIMLLRRILRAGQLHTGSNFGPKGSETARQLHRDWQFNRRICSSNAISKVVDDLDDLYGALGAYTLNVAASGEVQAGKNGYTELHIKRLHQYVRDSYDFYDEGTDQEDKAITPENSESWAPSHFSRWLGYWSWDDVAKTSRSGTVQETCLDKNGKRYFLVTNAHFRKYRETYNAGGDFLVYSDINVSEFSRPFVVNVSQEEIDYASKTL